nr:hypothetical protein [Tanacetum cinerariifolium]
MLYNCINPSKEICIHLTQQKDIISKGSWFLQGTNPKHESSDLMMLKPEGTILNPIQFHPIHDGGPGIVPSGKSDFLKGSRVLRCERAEPNVQKRMLTVTRSPAKFLHLDHAKEFGNNFKNLGIVVDLVNLCPEVDYIPKRLALNAFVAAVINNQNNHIKHLIAGCPIRNLLSSRPAIVTPEEIAAAADLKMPHRLPQEA